MTAVQLPWLELVLWLTWVGVHGMARWIAQQHVFILCALTKIICVHILPFNNAGLGVLGFVTTHAGCICVFVNTWHQSQTRLCNITFWQVSLYLCCGWLSGSAPGISDCSTMHDVHVYRCM
jgi:hypothetical protein